MKLEVTFSLVVNVLVLKKKRKKKKKKKKKRVFLLVSMTAIVPRRDSLVEHDFCFLFLADNPVKFKCILCNFSKFNFCQLLAFTCKFGVNSSDMFVTV